MTGWGPKILVVCCPRQENTPSLDFREGVFMSPMLRMAADVAGIVVAVIDPSSGQVRGGPDLAGLVGLPEGEVCLSPEEARALIHPDDRERVARAVESAFLPRSQGTLQSERVDRWACRSLARARWSSSRCGTRAEASRPNSCPTSSSASGRRMPRPRGCSEAWASGWPS